MAHSLLAAVLAAVLSVALAGAALAAIPMGGETLRLQGQAAIVGTPRQPQLLMSADGGGYHLDATLSPTFTRSRQGPRGDDGFGRGENGSRQGAPSRSDGVDLSGDYTLTGPGISPIDGRASGFVSGDGTGALSLADSNGSPLLSGDFSVDGSGSLEISLTGQLSSSEGRTSVSGPVTTQYSPEDHTFWYIARAAGLSAYLMLFLNIVLGLAVHTRFMDGLLARWRSFDLHEFTGLLAMGFLALHGLSLLGDRYVGFNLQQILIPMESTYRPFWIAVGIIAFYLVAMVTASSHLRRRIGYRGWKALHMTSYVAYLMALAHGIMAGTDTARPWAWFMYWATGSIVLVLTLWRFGFFGTDRPAMAREERRSTGGAG